MIVLCESSALAWYNAELVGGQKVATVIREEQMARPKGRPKKPSGEGTPVRIDSDLVTMARYVAAKQGSALSELVSGWLRPIVEREFRKVGKDLLEGEKR